MKQKIFFLVFIGGFIALNQFNSPAPTQAGGWPCFLCHGGFEVAGTDLAPPLAGSKLTDEQIIAQVRRPRGVMPAFSEKEISDQNLKDGFIAPFMRALPAGKPTATLSSPDRAAALKTISAVTSKRARAQPTATPTPKPPSAEEPAQTGFAWMVVLVTLLGGCALIFLSSKLL